MIRLDNISRDDDATAMQLWEALFREVEAWKWKSLYDFLCDLSLFEEKFADNEEVIFYWKYDSTAGITSVSSSPERYSIYDGVYRIQYSYKERFVEAQKEI